MKLVVDIEPGWFHGTRRVELELDPADYEGYTEKELEWTLAEVAQDLFNNEVSWGWHVERDD